MTGSSPVRRLSEVGVTDTAFVGGKGANLGELTRAGLPVPPGFVITALAYLQAVQHGGLRRELAAAASAASDPHDLYPIARDLSRRIRDIDIPADIVEPVLLAYRELGEPAVAVRSSATGEDTCRTSFAGMNETFTNVSGPAELLTCIKECWASAYGARAIAYRAEQGLLDEPAIAVVVQTMVRSERSGVIFTADPRTDDRNRMVIEAAFGLGEVVTAGRLVPDTYVLDSRGPRLLEVTIGYKDHEIISGIDGRDVHIDLPVGQATRRVLDNDEIRTLARLALRVEGHYGRPQDIEWAIQDGVTYILQSRSITTPAPLPATGGTDSDDVRGLLLSGVGAAPGIASGPVRILTSPEDGELFRDGEILVAATTSPDWMPILRRAAAIVTDGGGITCHTAIVSRELSIPAVVGTRSATRVLSDGQFVRVNGPLGVVEEGPGPGPSPLLPVTASRED